ncbi:MAG TPA: ATP-binding protein [bacterium]|nr:ATP-binding protein [bacterium]HPN93518.1 ATP-binding protein [bacterium]
MSKTKRTTMFGKLMRSNLLTLAFAALIFGAAYSVFAARYLKSAAEEDMTRAALLASSVISRNLEGAALTSRLLAQNYEIRSGLPAGDKDRISAEIEKELKNIEADFITVAGADGVSTIRASRRPLPPEFETSALSEPLFLSPAFHRASTSGEPAVGIEPVFPGGLGIVAIAPTKGEDGEIIGFVRIGFHLDDRFVETVREMTQADLAIERRGEIIASTARASGQEPLLASALSKSYLIHSSEMPSEGTEPARLLALYPKNRIARALKQGLAAIAAIAAVALAVSAFASARLSRRIVSPISDLIYGAERIQAGDFGRRLDASGPDELRELATAFNRMAEALTQRDAEIKINQDQLVESGKLAAVGELAAGVAHEIGNPLAAILGYVQLINTAPPEKISHYLERIAQEAGFIDQTIRDLLEFSRPAAAEDQVFAADDAVDEALRMLSFHKMMKHIEVKRTRPQKSPLIKGGKKEITQAVMNIALNAAQAMKGHGTLDVTTGSEGATAFIKIRDTGPGVKPENIKRIFDPFFTTRGDGVGLGLSITYKIIERHNGSIQVLSPPGSGAEFAILLPLAAQA